MIHFMMILFIILEYVGMMVIEPEKVTTPVVCIILLVHVMVFIGYTILYPNKE